ncbi:MAG TPA: AAA family ATPase [bacterium]
MGHSIEKLTVEGFKSIKQLTDFPLKQLNIMIGANGSGKSNTVSFFRLIRNMINRNLQYYIQKNGGPEAHLFMGSKFTERILGKISFGKFEYEFKLEPTTDNRLIIADERFYSNEPDRVRDAQPAFVAQGFEETKLVEAIHEGPGEEIALEIYPTITNWSLYHFHDTSDTAKIKRPCAINQNERLDEDGANLAAFLYPLYQKIDVSYRKIRDVVRLVAPFFDDFYLRPLVNNPEQIQLEWKQRYSEQPFLASQLSDGTLRFICLATILLQPRLPTTIIIDEPELGIHPYALSLLADLIKQTSIQTQILVATQSATFLDLFDPGDIVVIDRVDNYSVFKRLESDQLKEWLQDYTLGELWQKNIFGGRP